MTTYAVQQCAFELIRRLAAKCRTVCCCDMHLYSCIEPRSSLTWTCVPTPWPGFLWLACACGSMHGWRGAGLQGHGCKSAC
jgi:hypothetical protein